MDFDLDLAIKVVSLFWTILVLPVAWFIQQHRNRLTEVESGLGSIENNVKLEIEKRFAERARSMGEVKDRLAEIEATLKHAPSKDEIHEIALAVSELGGQLKALGASVTGMRETVTRVDSYLLEQASK